MSPETFGPDIIELLKEKLYNDVTSTFIGRFGYIITITAIKNIGEGRIRANSGIASFLIRFEAIVFKPLKEEVLDGEVTIVNQQGLFC